jgi:hypothetical protein
MTEEIIYSQVTQDNLSTLVNLRSEIAYLQSLKVCLKTT